MTGGGFGLVHPLLPCQALGQALIPLPSRERGKVVVLDLLGGLCVVRIRVYRIMGDLQDCDDAMHRFVDY